MNLYQRILRKANVFITAKSFQKLQHGLKYQYFKVFGCDIQLISNAAVPLQRLILTTPNISKINFLDISRHKMTFFFNADTISTLWRPDYLSPPPHLT